MLSEVRSEVIAGLVEETTESPYEAVKRRESSARTYASTFEAVFESGAGIRMRDQSGREIVDCLSCAGALPLGHNHPEVRDALLRFLGSGHVQQALDLTTPAKCEFLDELFGLLPDECAGRAKVQFCSPSGSDAVEAAMKLVRFATGRQSIISFHGAYHGMTGGALAAMGNLTPKAALPGGTGAIHFAPFPYHYRCPFGTDGRNTDSLSIQYLRTLLSDPDSGISQPAAVIVEVVQGEGGCIPASDEWLRELRQLTQANQILLIIDEVQTGFARTGTMFAFQRARIVPDVLILSKAVGGGFPLAVVVYDEALDRWPPGMHAGTFRGNQIAMVAGKITMEILRRDRLAEHAAEMGALLMAGLRRIANEHAELGDVRGRGLMVGVEVVAPSPGATRGRQDGALSAAIKRAAFENGLLIETGGRHGSVLRLLPPLIVTRSDVGEILDRLDTAVVRAKREVTRRP
jgi:diaminobutyrate-2-oxoglutarate transaminase